MTAPVSLNPYEMLGVSRQATAAEIHRAWLDAIKRIHPDHALSEPERLQREELTRELNAAYHAIKDPTRRADVDAELRYGDDTQRTTTTGRPKEHDGGVNKRPDPTAAKTADVGGWSNVPPPPVWQAEWAAATEARYGITHHQHHFRADLFSRRGLLRFLTHDRVGQWLVSLTWLAVLTWMISPAFKIDSVTYLSFALAGLGLQAVVARRLEHTPLHDLLRVSRAIVIGLFLLIAEIASVSSSKSPRPPRDGLGVGWDPRWEEF